MVGWPTWVIGATVHCCCCMPTMQRTRSGYYRITRSRVTAIHMATNKVDNWIKGTVLRLVQCREIDQGSH